MRYTENDKKKALAIVKIFETSKPQGNYAAIAVLNDGAGISYGINQFTHRSGSLADVVKEYLRSGGVVGKTIIEPRLKSLNDQTVRSIDNLSKDEVFKKALIAAALTSEMRSAQDTVLFDRYLQPAINACEGSDFTSALSLAVVYDSITHGSWQLIRDRVKTGLSEKDWITKYVVLRNSWLASIPRLRSTVYRTSFFLEQIARQNWDLKMPLRVHGIKLTDSDLGEKVSTARAFQTTAIRSAETDVRTIELKPISALNHDQSITVSAKPEPSKHSADRNWFEMFERLLLNLFSRFDRVESIINAILARTETAKRIYAAIAAAISQMAVSVLAFASGTSLMNWIIFAAITAVVVTAFIYYFTEKNHDRS